MEPQIDDVQIESLVHELLDFQVSTNQMSSAIYQCSNDHTEELNIENPKKKPYNCPYYGSKCNVKGDIKWLLLHLRNNVEMHDGRSFSHHHNPKHLHHATRMLTLLDCLGRQFCLYLEAFHLRKTPMYIAFMQFMGDEEEAMSFSYALEVGGNGRRKLTWQGVPRSIRDSHRMVRYSQDSRRLNDHSQIGRQHQHQ